MFKNLTFCLIAISFAFVSSDLFAESRPSVLIITVDDMSCDSVGAFGCKLADTTPNMDRLAKQGMRFAHAHMQVGNCMPGRNVLLSGFYPHTNGVEGFRQVKNPKHPHMCDLMKKAGYFTAIRGKVTHSTPYFPYAWDSDLDTLDGVKQNKKDPKSFYRSTKRGIELSAKANKPFCLLINIADPHKPFYKGPADNFQPSKTFAPAEVPIPGFLFDHPDVRRELALYYSTVRRADDAVGEVLKALDESGKSENTVVMFLSDHGMPLPFAKTQLYYHSTRTPWIVKWPGKTKPGTVDETHMISAVDFLPTLLEIIGAKHSEKFQGRSFKPLLEGKSQEGREFVITEYNENSGRIRHPIRGVASKKYGYLFNPWSDGKRQFKTATQGTATYRVMKKLALTDEKIAARLKLFDHRVREEFYDYENDPDALNNLIDDPKYKSEIEKHRKVLSDWMKQTEDHALAAFSHRDSEEAVQAYMAKLEKESENFRANRRKQNRGARKGSKGSPGKGQKNSKKSKLNLIDFVLPEVIEPGGKVSLTINHNFSEKLGEQKIHATLKDSNNKRIQRIVVKAKGKGRAVVKFKLPKSYSGKNVIFAAFVGESFQENLQHRNSAKISVTK